MINGLTKEDFNRLSAFENKVKYVSRLENPLEDAIVAYEPTSNSYYMVKELAFEEVASFHKKLAEVGKYKALSHQNLLKLINYSTISKGDAASQCFKIRLLFENASLNCMSETQNKLKLNQRPFKAEELLYMIYDLVEAYAYLQTKEIVIKGLNPYHIYTNKNNNFIIGNMLSNPITYQRAMIDRCAQGSNMYLSPEFFEIIQRKDAKALNKIDVHKSEVFVLGLCILEVATGVPCSDVYSKDNKLINQDRLKEHVKRFDEMYRDNPLASNVLKVMLIIDLRVRPDFQVLKKSLPPLMVLSHYFDVIRTKQGRRKLVVVNNAKIERVHSQDNLADKKSEMNSNRSHSFLKVEATDQSTNNKTLSRNDNASSNNIVYQPRNGNQTPELDNSSKRFDYNPQGFEPPRQKMNLLQQTIKLSQDSPYKPSAKTFDDIYTSPKPDPNSANMNKHYEPRTPIRNILNQHPNNSPQSSYNPFLGSQYPADNYHPLSNTKHANTSSDAVHNQNKIEMLRRTDNQALTGLISSKNGFAKSEVSIKSIMSDKDQRYDLPIMALKSNQKYTHKASISGMSNIRQGSILKPTDDQSGRLYNSRSNSVIRKESLTENKQRSSIVKIFKDQ